MADSNLRGGSASKPGMFNKEAEGNSTLYFACRSPDDEPLVRQPPKPTELDSMNSEPDPDLQLTPLKQSNQPKSLLRPHGANSKVRHRVRFQESGGFSSESRDISNRISEVAIAEDFSEDCEVALHNRNNNSMNIEHMFPDVSYPNSSNCMFLDDSSDSLSPRLLSVEVIRETNQSQSSLSSTLISDFPTESDLQTDRSSSGESRNGSENSSKSRIPSPEILTKNVDPRDIYFESLSKDGNGAMPKRKTSKSIVNKENHFFQGGTVGTDSNPGVSRSSSSSVSAGDKEATSLFGEPELHSTLQIAQRIKTLQKKRPDLRSELKKNLENEQQRNKINEKAACKVDIRPNEDLYSGLISLDVTNFELEEAAIVQRPTKVKPVKKKTPSGMEPDLLEFFTEDLQKETAVFSLPGIRNPSIETCKAPALIAFDLYRHNRMWEGLPGTV